VVNNLRERRQFERLLGVLLATCAVASVIGTLQIPSGQRVSAPFEGAQGEPNTFGGYLILMLAVVAGLYLTSRSVRLKVPLVVLAGLIVLPLAFTLSRATYLAVIPLGIALFVWGRRRLFLAAGLALALALGPFVVPDVVVERLRYTFAQPPEEGQRQLVGIRLDTSTSARFGSWEQVLFEDWSKHPVFGYGVTGYRFVDAQYPRTLAEMGLVGLLALLWLQGSLFREARRVLERARDPLFRGVALGFLGGFVALLAHSIGANTFIIVRTMEPFWFLAGMVMMIPQLEAAGAPTTVPDVARPRQSAWRPRAAGEAHPRPT
jgi:O-antigen ligase